MKRTEYNEHMRNIKCSEEFKAKMEKKLSSPPNEVHEYEDSVQGVERAKTFNVSRFAALAAALVIIGGSVGFGLKSMKNVPLDRQTSVAEQIMNVPEYEESPYSDLNNINIRFFFNGKMSDYNYNDAHCVTDISDETKQAVKDKLLNFKWQSTSYNDIPLSSLNDIMESNVIYFGFFSGDDPELTAFGVTDDDRVFAPLNPEGKMLRQYDPVPGFYEEMKNIIESNIKTGSQTFEIAEQEDINIFIDENVSDKINISKLSDIVTPPAEYRGEDFMLTSDEIQLDDLNAVKERMKSMQWEKCDKIFPYTEENANIEKQISWMNGGNILFFTDKGLLYTPEECYKAANRDEANELLDMLYANIDKADPKFRMAAQLTEGCKFRNFSCQFDIRFNVPAEASIIDDGHWLATYGDYYFDNETGEIMYSGRAVTSNEVTDPVEFDPAFRKFVYRKYPDGKEFYEERLKDGTVTAHYEGYDDLFPIFDYAGLYKKILKDIYVFDENEEDVMPYVDEDNGVNGHTYTFLLSKTQTRDTELWVGIDNQGRLQRYSYQTFAKPFLLEDNAPEDLTEESAETVYEEQISMIGSYVEFDKDDFSIPTDNGEYDR